MTSPKNRYSIARYMVLTVAIGAAAAIYTSLKQNPDKHTGSQTTNLLSANQKRTKAFHDANSDHWKSEGFVPLNDRKQLQESMDILVAHRFGEPNIDEVSLASDLSEFLYAFGAPNVDAFLGRLPSGRQLIDSPFDKKMVHANYRAASGGAMPDDLDSFICLKYFWDLSSEQSGRPKLVSKKGYIKIALSKTYPRGGGTPGKRLLAQVMPKNGEGGIRLTQVDTTRCGCHRRDRDSALGRWWLPVP